MLDKRGSIFSYVNCFENFADDEHEVGGSKYIRAGCQGRVYSRGKQDTTPVVITKGDAFYLKRNPTLTVAL